MTLFLLIGYDKNTQKQIDKKMTETPCSANECNVSKITGTSGIPCRRNRRQAHAKIRHMDKLVDELARKDNGEDFKEVNQTIIQSWSLTAISKATVSEYFSLSSC